MFPEFDMIERFGFFKHFGQFKGVGQIHDHFEPQSHDGRVQVHHFIASTAKKNAVGKFNQAP